MMTPEKFASEMQRIKEEHGWDKEVCHGVMDDLLCKVLIEHGYSEGVKIFEETGKWYA